MGNLFSRFSLAAVSLIAAALIFGFLAGGVVVHRFQTTSQTQTNSKPDQQPEKNDEQADQQGEGKDQENSHASGGRTNEPPDSQGND
jgi:transcription initiation factor TFIID subunit TAF12